MIEAPATTISEQRGKEEPIFYLIGPRRATLQEAEEDLLLWRLAESLRSTFPSFLLALEKLTAEDTPPWQGEPPASTSRMTDLGEP